MHPVQQYARRTQVSRVVALGRTCVGSHSKKSVAGSGVPVGPSGLHIGQVTKLSDGKRNEIIFDISAAIGTGCVGRDDFRLWARRTRPYGLAFVRATHDPQPLAGRRSTHPASD